MRGYRRGAATKQMAARRRAPSGSILVARALPVGLRAAVKCDELFLYEIQQIKHSPRQIIGHLNDSIGLAV
jgi:hypothetical protein